MTLQFTPRLSSKHSRYPNRIREYRLRLGLTQRALGQRLRKNRKIISAWERGVRFPAGPIVFRLAKALNTLTEALYQGLYCSLPEREDRTETHA